MALQQDLEAVERSVPDYRARALVLAANCAVALEWSLPRAALLSARGAARSALLALGAMSHRAAIADLVLLQKAALLPSTGRLAGQHDDAETLVPKVLAVVRSLLSDLPAGANGDTGPPFTTKNYPQRPTAPPSAGSVADWQPHLAEAPSVG
jgi:hypothetical protein